MRFQMLSDQRRSNVRSVARVPWIIRGLVACVAICGAVSVTQASTIFKLNLGNVGPDVQMTASGVLGTISDGDAVTTGDQNTDVQFTGGLSFLPSIATNGASFSLTGVTATGPANVFGTLVVQNFTGGTFSLYDPANTLLLTGPLTTSALTGTIGPPATGSLFSTTLGTVTGGILAPLIVPGTVSMSMSLNNVNGGAGFSVAAVAPILQPFLADASTTVAADVVPEPATLSLLLIGCTTIMLPRRRVR